jgi:hypothetical protein
MALEIAIIVTDSPPLITLAAAQSLDYLLYPNLPVIIPDAVFYEATSGIDKLGAQEIIDWYNENEGRVVVKPTKEFKEDSLLRDLIPGRKRAKDIGEKSALEIIRNFPFADNAKALLLSDDRDAERMVMIEPEKAILLTTWDFLRQLEEAQRIQSADAVMEAVRKLGRNLPKRDLWSDHDPEVRDAIRAVIERAHRRDEPKT